MTIALTRAEAIEALELYGQHHPDCAALWPEKPCDCGLAALGVKTLPPRIDMHRESPEKRLDWSSTDYHDRKRGPGGAAAERPGFRNGVGRSAKRPPAQETPEPKERSGGGYISAVTVGMTETTVTKQCTRCKSSFTQPRRHGRLFSKCEACR